MTAKPTPRGQTTPRQANASEQPLNESRKPTMARMSDNQKDPKGFDSMHPIDEAMEMAFHFGIGFGLTAARDCGEAIEELAGTGWGGALHDPAPLVAAFIDGCVKFKMLEIPDPELHVRDLLGECVKTCKRIQGVHFLGAKTKNMAPPGYLAAMLRAGVDVFCRAYPCLSKSQG
jgi:hypothetical protein